MDSLPRIDREGQNVFYRGRYLYSERDPKQVPARIGVSLESLSSRLFVVQSPLLWHGITEALDTIHPTSALLAIEADPALLALARDNQPDMVRNNPRVRLVDARNSEAVLAAARDLGRFRACVSVKLNAASFFYEELYNNILSGLEASFRVEWTNQATLMQLGSRWAKNIFDNLAQLASRNFVSLSPAYKPVAVCGAGPSLEAALPFLHAHRSNLSIIACDTALQPLLQGGISPDLVVCLESQFINIRDFYSAQMQDIFLSVDLTSYPQTMRIPGQRFLTFTHAVESAFLERVEHCLHASTIPFLPLPPLGSVGVLSTRLAQSTGSTLILLCGLDFCFERGKTHCRSSPQLGEEINVATRLNRWNLQYHTSTSASCTACAPIRNSVNANIKRKAFSKHSSFANVESGSITNPHKSRTLFTTEILKTYASLVTTGGTVPQLYLLNSDASLVTAPAIDSETASQMLTNYCANIIADSKEVPEAENKKVDEGKAKKVIIDFLAQEHQRLRILETALRNGDPRYLELLKDCDYLLWPFANNIDAPTQGFLNRLVPEIKYWQWRLKRLLV